MSVSPFPIRRDLSGITREDLVGSLRFEAWMKDPMLGMSKRGSRGEQREGGGREVRRRRKGGKRKGGREEGREGVSGRTYRFRRRTLPRRGSRCEGVKD